jgi:TRAP-type mannitol/chloroaromatic compound transport system substrate-binding protein
VFGNGNKLKQEIYDKHGLVAFDAVAIGPETSGWFRKEIKSVDDLKRIKFRFFGLGAKVLQKLGVSTQLIAPADIFQALERGVIDATEFSMPSVDIGMGFHQVAKFNYFPGWHQPVTVAELLMHKKAFDALPKAYKKILEVAAGNQIHFTYAESEAKQFAAMAEMTQKHKVQIKRWADEDLAAIQKAWLDVLEDESGKDPLFKKIADDYLAFRKSYAIWGEAQAMKPTYARTKQAQ